VVAASTLSAFAHSQRDEGENRQLPTDNFLPQAFMIYSELARQAAMNPRNNGWGAFGFDRNSG
jgi:hypothetical protein